MLIQEQGRWEDSLTMLARDNQATATVLGQLYRRSALVALTRMLPSEMHEALDYARQTMSSATSDNRVVMASIALMMRIRDHSHDESVTSGILDALPLALSRDLPPDERDTLTVESLKLRFAKGMTHEERHEVLAQLEELASRTNAWHVPSARSFSIVAGIGILNTSLGRCDQALAPFDAALRLAQRLDDSSRIAGTLGNLAISLGWLGHHQQQRDVASRALAILNRGAARPYSALIATYELALASAMLGDHVMARETILQQRTRVTVTATDAIKQIWLLHEADIRQLLREDDCALELSLEALRLGNGRILDSTTSAGAACRAALRALEHTDTEGRTKLRTLIADQYASRGLREIGDAVEVTCAYIIAHPMRSYVGGEVRQELRAMLERLPATAARRLEALGTPPPAECLRYVEEV